MEEIVTGEAVILDLPCARFPTRLLAHLIDMVVQGLGIVLVFIVIIAAGNSLNEASGPAVLITGLVLVLVGYPVASETLSRGRTLGKLALGLRVVADDGGPVRFRQALVRGLASVAECWALFGVPAIITSMISARGKRLGDVFAGTFVLRERVPRAPASPFPAGLPGAGYPAAPYPVMGQVPSLVEPALRPWAATLDLAGLPEQLVASVNSYLSRYRQLDPRARDQLGWQLATDVTRRVTPPPPPGLPPVAYLYAVVAERRNRDLARHWAAAAPLPPGPAPVAYPPAPAPAATYPAGQPPVGERPEFPSPQAPEPTPVPQADGFAPPQ